MLHQVSALLVVVSLVCVQALAEDTVSADPGWRVVRAQFTTAIVDREPVDEVVVLSPPSDAVFFFSEIRNMEGRTVTHRWEYQGELVSRVPFEVKGPRWRVFSKYSLSPDTFGEWSVTVVDESGWPLYTELFRYERSHNNSFSEPPATLPSQ